MPEVITDVLDPLDEAQQAFLRRYVDAFDRYDLDALTALLHEAVVQATLPYELWLQGHADVRGWYLGTGIGCKGSKLVATTANGSPAFAQYRPTPDGGIEAWALQRYVHPVDEAATRVGPPGSLPTVDEFVPPPASLGRRRQRRHRVAAPWAVNTSWITWDSDTT